MLASLPIHGCDVDDEPLAIDGLEAQCERVEDLEIVDTAADGEAALGLLEAQRPDFLFLDIGMPGLTGIDVAGRLQQMSDPPLVIFATAYGHFATEAFDLGVTVPQEQRGSSRGMGP